MCGFSTEFNKQCTNNTWWNDVTTRRVPLRGSDITGSWHPHPGSRDTTRARLSCWLPHWPLSRSPWGLYAFLRSSVLPHPRGDTAPLRVSRGHWHGNSSGYRDVSHCFTEYLQQIITSVIISNHTVFHCVPFVAFMITFYWYSLCS